MAAPEFLVTRISQALAEAHWQGRLRDVECDSPFSKDDMVKAAAVNEAILWKERAKALLNAPAPPRGST